MKNGRRSLALILCIVSLAACGRAETPISEAKPALVRYIEIGALYATLNAGETVMLTAEEGDWYVVALDGMTVRVEKRFVRLASEVAEEAWTGYARSGAVSYGDVYLRGPETSTLRKNTKLRILETMGECMLAELPDETRVFVAADMVSRTRIPDNDGGGGGGGGGGGAPSNGVDGEAIPLAYRAPEQFGFVLLTTDAAAFAPQSGAIKVDGVEAYIKLLHRGEEVTARNEIDGRTELLIDGLVATVPTDALLMDGTEAYEPWEGYVQATVRGSGDLRLRRDKERIARNTLVTALDMFDAAYLVETPDGLTYVDIKLVDKNRAPVKNNGGGDGGGGGGVSEEWTDSVL